jgi:hypothetical protein
MESRVGSAGTVMVGFPFPIVPGAIPFPIATPAPTGTGMVGMLLTCGGGAPDLETGLYGANDAGLGLPAALCMKTPWGFDQGACPALPGILGGMACACALAAFRLRLINRAAATPASNSPSKIATMAAIRGVLSDELVVGVAVLLPLLLPDVEPFVAGVELLPTVGEALTAGDAPAVAVAVSVAVGVGVTPDVAVGEGVGLEVGDGWGVGEGGTTGAWKVKFVEDESVAGCPLPE